MLTRGTLAYIGQRLVLIAFTVVAVSSLVFIGIHQLPGNAFISERVRGDRLELVLHEYGLDRPLTEQYQEWATNAFLHGDLGQSFVNRGLDITPLVLRELTVSAEVGGTALLITIGLGMLLGVIAAIKQNTWIDYLLTTTSVIGYSMPSFVLASFLLLFFAVFLASATGGAFYYPLHWSGTYGDPIELSIPAFALGFPYASIVARLTRASMLEVIRQDYIRTARAKGLRERVVIIRHGLRNALIPVTTILGPLVIGIITGSVVIESIFTIPGLGKEFVGSILRHDYNITIGVFTMYALMVGVANLLVDISYTAIDPRIRY
ncbi:MAG: ABC transporter permease [Candidatus Dormiibacterota bacterium]